MEIWHENSLAGEAGHNFILDKLILYDQTGDMQVGFLFPLS